MSSVSTAAIARSLFGVLGLGPNGYGLMMIVLMRKETRILVMAIVILIFSEQPPFQNCLLRAAPFSSLLVASDIFAARGRLRVT